VLKLGPDRLIQQGKLLITKRFLNLIARLKRQRIQVCFKLYQFRRQTRECLIYSSFTVWKVVTFKSVYSLLSLRVEGLFLSIVGQSDYCNCYLIVHINAKFPGYVVAETNSRCSFCLIGLAAFSNATMWWKKMR